MMTVTNGGLDPVVSGLHPLLLDAGLVGAPLFVLVFVVEGARRRGYDWLRQPISTLGLGEGGWIQRANFVVTGLLPLGPAVVLGSGPIGAWMALLLGGFAAGLVGAGVFSTYPVGGYPPHTPPPPHTSAAGAVHVLLSFVAIACLAAACFVAAAGLVAGAETGWAVYSAVTGGVFLALFFLYGAAMASHGRLGRSPDCSSGFASSSDWRGSA